MTTAIVQARMGSTRLPGKVLEDIAGRPMLWHVVHRVRAAGLVDEVVVATSTSDEDDPVEAFCEEHGIPCFRGSEEDVLDRFHRAAERHGADPVVRITGDCPLSDPRVIDRVVRAYHDLDADYVTNVLPYTYPDGLDVEVFSFAALETAAKEATTRRDREHVTPFIRNDDRFAVANVEAEVDLSREGHRWTVDHPEDLSFVRRVYELAGEELFGMETVLAILEEHPEVRDMNRDIVRNEGAYLSFTKEPPVPPKARKLDRSMHLLEAAAERIPSASQTFSKRPKQYVRGVTPVFVERAEGCRVFDVDGNAYLDYPMALGPVVLGHCHPHVTRAVQEQLGKGTTFSLPHPLEVEVADLLAEIIPCAEMVRFGKNGSDATSGAVRVARAFTSRDVVAVCGYHGWQDWYVASTSRNAGVPKTVQRLTVKFHYNDLDSLRQVFEEHPDEVAAVVMEPVGVTDPKEGFLEGVRDLTHEHGALLVFDEIVTGFRLALGGAQEHYGVEPDLACFGKAMANGYPLSSVVGRRDVMELFDEVFFSFTFGGEALSLAACKATIGFMQEHDVVAHLWEQGKRLKDGTNVLARHYGIDDHVRCVGLPPRTALKFVDTSGSEWIELKSLFIQECVKRGVLVAGSHLVSHSHGAAEIDETLRVYRTVFEILSAAIEAQDVAQRLEGPPVEPVFRSVE